MTAPTARPMTAGDRDQVLDLKVAVFDGCDRGSERKRWRWQWQDNPAFDDDTPRGVVIEVGDALAGSFAFVPMRMQIGDRVGLALDGIDLCVDAGHRGAGLGRVVNEVLWRKGFCDFPFATGVNAASHRLFSAGGATLLGGTVEQTGFAYFIHDRHPDAPSFDLEVREVDRFLDGADRLWEDVRDEWRLGIVRDAAYLNWRYRDHPFRTPTLLVVGEDEHLRGVAVLQDDPALNRWYLLELVTAASDRDARGALLAAVRRQVASSSCEAVYYATRQDGQRECLAAADFRPVPGDVPTFMGKLHDTTQVEVTDWCVSLGDGDQLYGVGATS